VPAIKGAICILIYILTSQPALIKLDNEKYWWALYTFTHAKCCMDGKRIRCLHCLAACAHLPITVCEIERDICEKIIILSYPLAFDAPVRGVPVGMSAPFWYGKTRMVSLPDGEKNSKICLKASARQAGARP